MAAVPAWEFRRLASRHGLLGPKLRFTAWEHLLTMAFAQLTRRESLRDIVGSLRAQPRLAYHLGLRHLPARSTLADANEHRPWALFAELATRLMQRARTLYQTEPNALELDAPLYAIDSSMIELSLALCPWADWTGRVAALKLHTQLDLRGPLPARVLVTEGGHGDAAWLDVLPVEPGAYYLMDRGYVDLQRLRRIAASGAYFVVRERDDVLRYVVQSRPVDRTGSLRSDQSIRFRGRHSRAHWPDALRRVSLYDCVHRRHLAFWTNQWALPAALIAELYRQRWQVELFFRWIKQNLRLHSFYGTTPNAVRVQIWTALCAYLCAAITRHRNGLAPQISLTNFLQIVSIHSLAKLPLAELFTNKDTKAKAHDQNNQMQLMYL
jgi:transposase